MSPRVHELKTWPVFFAAVADGSKPFEVRKNDRDFQVGDHLLLREFDPVRECYTARTLTKRVTYVMLGGRFGVDVESAVLGLGDL